MIPASEERPLRALVTGLAFTAVCLVAASAFTKEPGRNGPPFPDELQAMQVFSQKSSKNYKVQSTLNPGAQRAEMIQLLRSIDAHLKKIEAALAAPAPAIIRKSKR
ncbi:MAG: hypothetical protein ACE5H3_02240 [Planctomycetota bacterium]